jgi:hypothetical protein
MEILARDVQSQLPRIVIEMVESLDPDHPKITIRYENTSGGWITVVHMLHGALGAALPQAFAQIQQQSTAQEDQKRILLVPDMRSVH